MLTDDKRREIARNLREFSRIYKMTLPPTVICDALGIPKSPHLHGYSGDGVLELADMIEPEPERTCEAVYMNAGGNPPYNNTGLSLNSSVPGCSVCGMPWNFPGFTIPKHCPNCDAKVTGEIAERLIRK